MCALLGQQECPLYPTELAFALDTSSDVDRRLFNNMRETVLRLVRDITITESNCPRGARVALTMFNSEVTTEVRFADALKKRALLQRIEGLQTLQTNKKRSLESAMSFLAQNTFKRVRSGFLMRKVAIFFVGGTIGNAQTVTNAALRLHDAGIATLFLVNRDDRQLSRALQVRQNTYFEEECDCTSIFKVTVLHKINVFSAQQVNGTELAKVIVLPSASSSQYASVLQNVMKCHVCLGNISCFLSCVFSYCSANPNDRKLKSVKQIHCLNKNKLFICNTITGHLDVLCCSFPDICSPDQMCGYVPPLASRDRRSFTTDVDIDMAFVMDSSESTYPSIFTEIKHYISHIVEHLQVSSNPTSSAHHARVSVIQQAPYEFVYNKTGSPIHVDVGLTEYQSSQDIIKFLLEKTPQLEGGRSLAAAMEATVEQVFETAPLQRARKVLMLFVTGNVEEEEAQLVRLAIDVKCRGYFLVILGVGENLSAGDARVLSRMASEPSDVFFKRLDSISHFYDKHIQNFGQLLPKYISSKVAFLFQNCSG